MSRPTVQNEIHDKLRHITSDLALQVRRINQNIQKIDDFTCEIPDFTPMIREKSITVLQELLAVPWHPMLKEVVFWVLARWPDQIIFTSGHREDDKGVHGLDPLRGIDLRSSEFKNPRVVEYEINLKWDYGKEPYQVCVYHQTVLCKECGHKFEIDPEVGMLPSTICQKCGLGWAFLKDFGPHFHLQSRNETKEKLT